MILISETRCCVYTPARKPTSMKTNGAEHALGIKCSKSRNEQVKDHSETKPHPPKWGEITLLNTFGSKEEIKPAWSEM